MITLQRQTDSEALTDFTVKFSPSNRVAFSLRPVKSSVPAPKSSPRFGQVLSAPSKILPPDSPCSSSIHEQFQLGEFFELACCISDRPKNLPGLLPRKKRFTRSAKQTLLSAGGALEKEGFKPEDFYFFTGTLPGSTFEAMRELARYSGFALNRLKQSLRDDGIFLTLNSWEWQKRKALHLHLIYVCPDAELGKKLQNKIKENWYDVLDDISKKSGHSLYQKKGFAAYTRHSLPVQKYGTRTIRCESKPGSSPVAYLAKYLGKGFSSQSDNEKSVKSSDFEQVFYPSSWWSISSKVRELIEKHSCSYVVRLPASLALDQLHEFSELLMPVAKLALPPWQNPNYPEYIYRDLYIESAAYFDCAELFSDIFPSAEIAGSSSQSVCSGAASLQRYSYSALEYLRLSSNHALRDDFAFRYLNLEAELPSGFSLLYAQNFDQTHPGTLYLEKKARSFLKEKNVAGLRKFPSAFSRKDVCQRVIAYVEAGSPIAEKSFVNLPTAEDVLADYEEFLAAREGFLSEKEVWTPPDEVPDVPDVPSLTVEMIQKPSLNAPNFSLISDEQRAINLAEEEYIRALVLKGKPEKSKEKITSSDRSSVQLNLPLWSGADSSDAALGISPKLQESKNGNFLVGSESKNEQK